MYSTVYLKGKYDSDTISKLADDLSMGIITKLYIDAYVHKNIIIKVLGGLCDQCALSSLTIVDREINVWIDKVFDYVKSPIGFQLKMLHINLDGSSPDKLFQMLKSSQITKLAISGEILSADICQWSQYFQDNEYIEKLNFKYLNGITDKLII